MRRSRASEPRLVSRGGGFAERSAGVCGAGRDASLLSWHARAPLRKASASRLNRSFLRKPTMDQHHSRRVFLRRSAGLAALASLLGDAAARGNAPHFKPTAKRITYLFQSGAPSQLDLFDHKPKLKDLFAKDLPDSIRRGQRLTGMTATQDAFPVAPSKYKFAQHGKSSAWVSELLPHTATVVDDLC